MKLDRPLPPMPSLLLEDMTRPPPWRALVLYAVVIGSMLGFIGWVDHRERLELEHAFTPVEAPAPGLAARTGR